MRGRIPTPDAIKALLGKPVTKPLGSGPQFTVGAEPPDWLDLYARELWERCSSELMRYGMLTQVDAEALASYCVAMSMIRDLKRLCSDPALPVKEKMSAGRMLLKAQLVARALGAEFGFSPSARNRIVIPGAPKDELDDFMANKGETA